MPAGIGSASGERGYVAPGVPAASLVHTGVDPADVLDDPLLDPGVELHSLCRRVALIAHLTDAVVFFFRGNQKFAFFEGVRQRFLDIHGRPLRHRTHCDGKMGVIGHARRAGVDLAAHLIEHLAKIVVDFRAGMLLFETPGA
jgi:hypothetical protein